MCVCSVVSNFLRPYGLEPAGSSVHGLSQAGILEWVAISFFRGYSQPRDRTHVFAISCISRWVLYHWTTWEALLHGIPLHLFLFLLKALPLHFPLSWQTLLPSTQLLKQERRVSLHSFFLFASHLLTSPSLDQTAIFWILKPLLLMSLLPVCTIRQHPSIFHHVVRATFLKPKSDYVLFFLTLPSSCLWISG